MFCMTASEGEHASAHVNVVIVLTGVALSGADLRVRGYHAADAEGGKDVQDCGWYL